MAIPAMLETTQYKASPLGKVKEKNAMSSGIIHSIMFWLDCCRGSAWGSMVIFCWTQEVTKTSTGRTTLVESGLERSSHKNLASSGAAE
jgi:hypothetical protein